MNFTSRVHGGTPDKFGERNTHCAKLGNYVRHADGSIVASMQVGGNRVGQEALLGHRNSIAEPETSLSVTNIENYSTLARFGQDGIEFSVFQQNRKLLRKNMGVNVARTSFLQNQIGVGAIRPWPEVIHHRKLGGLRTSDRPVHCGPGS